MAKRLDGAKAPERCRALRQGGKSCLRGEGEPSMTFDELKEKAHALPLKPGVYIMQDVHSTVIYVARPRP